MIQAIKCFKLRANIFTLGRINQDFIGIATQSQNIKIFSTQQCQTVQNVYFDLLGEKTTALCFHPTLNLMAIANGEKLYIVNIQERNILQTILTHDGVIERLSFMPLAPYLISGTKNGRVMQYRYEGKIHISRLCSFPYSTAVYKKSIKNNYVSAIAHNSNYIAASGFGAAVTVVKFNSHATKFSFQVSKTRINAIAFLENKEILFANIDGTLFLSKIRKNAEITQINTQERDILQILPLPNTPYVLIISKSKTIMLFHTHNKKIIKRDFLHFEKELSSVLLLNENELLVTFFDNSAQKLFLGSTKMLEELLKDGEVLKALLLIEANPMLENSTQAEESLLLYEKLYKQVAMQLFQSKDKEILQELQPFEELKTKKDTIKKLLLAYENYPKLQDFYKEYKFSLAYALCEKHPSLKITPIYQKMEESYKKSFTLAQKQLLSQRVDKAKELLEPFTTVSSKRAMIQLLLRQNREFLAFLKAIAQKDYEQLNKLVKINSNFQEIPSYILLQQETLLQLNDINRLINEGNISQAINKIKELQHISMLKEDLQKLYKLTQEANKLLSYYEKNNFVQCYETIDSNPELESMQLTILLEEHWRKKVDKSELFALDGNIRAVKEELDELIHISSRKEKIGDLLRVSFHAKIRKELLARNYKSTENFIYSYIDIFGMDSEIAQSMKSYEDSSRKKLAITFMQKKHKDRNSWRYADII